MITFNIGDLGQGTIIGNMPWVPMGAMDISQYASFEDITDKEEQDAVEGSEAIDKRVG